MKRIRPLSPLALALSRLMALGIIPITSQPASLQSNGATPDYASLVGILGNINNFNIQDASQGFQTFAGATATVTPSPGQVTKFTNAGAITVTLDYAYNIVGQLVAPYVGQAFGFNFATVGAGGSIATPTLSDTAVTLVGTTSLAATSFRLFQGLVTQLSTVSGAPVTAGTTFTSLTQVGTTNAFTLVMGTNALSPTVGQAVLLNVSAGTLPSGWYPIVKVNSATSWVIATPPGVVWTMTAGTIPGTTTVPVANYTTGLPGLFSPLLTVTGMFTCVTTAA